MTSIVTTIGLKGLEGYRVQVEVQTKLGLESIRIVGLPDASVREAKERVAVALRSTGYSIIGQKIMVNLSPSELRKNGPLYDLPIAIAILLSLGLFEMPQTDEIGFIGALSLDGTIQPACGMLPAILAAKKLGIKKLYIPYDENLPTLHFEKIEIVYVLSLREVVDHILGKPFQSIYPYEAKQKEQEPTAPPQQDFQQIIGHSASKYALEVAAAGEHHLLMTGPPGCGKSLLAESFSSILPPLSKESQLEMISIYQLAGATIPNTNFPPFRNPHQSASGISIIGGGQNPKPGEISLAHRGALFLDEIAEFPRKTLEMLRQPLESGLVTICRARSTVSYPATFILIGAMNPCRCGYASANNRYCSCTKRDITVYQNKLSGPMRDRFDIFLNLLPVDLRQASSNAQEPSANIQKRVTEARERQYHRYGKEVTNNRVPLETLLKDKPLTLNQLQNLQEISSKHNWSNHTQIKIIKLARTIADLQQNNKISDLNITVAIKLKALTKTKQS